MPALGSIVASAVVEARAGEDGALTDAQLDEMSAEDMTGGRFDNTEVISEKFKDKSGGAIMAAKIAKYFFVSRSNVQHLFADRATTQVRMTMMFLRHCVMYVVRCSAVSR